MTCIVLSAGGGEDRRASALRKPGAGVVSISGRQYWTNLKALFGDEAFEVVLRFTEDTEVGKRLAGKTNEND